MNAVRLRLCGVVFLVIVSALGYLTIAVYQRRFTPVTLVSLETDSAGNQLEPGSDVKVHGLVVGEVRSISASAGGATLVLALQPDEAEHIPANVSARLLPKTLFGERYVSLIVPPHRSGQVLAAGDIIPEDRSSAAVELNKVLDDLLPVLQAVQPQRLATTLGAIATALAGDRGTELGATIDQLAGYLRQVNPALPGLDADIQELSTFASTYTQAAPDLLQALSNLTTTARTVAGLPDQLADLYASVTGSATDLSNFLAANENNLIQLTANSTATLDLLARYAPEYPCVLNQMYGLIPRANKALGEGTNEPHIAHVTVEISITRGKYVPGRDTPRFDDHRGPQCYSTAGRFPQNPPGGPLADGVSHAPAAGPVASYSGLAGALGTVQSSANPTSSPLVANSPAEAQLLGELLAPQLGVPPSEVPAWSSLLVGPIFRGAEVDLR